MIEFWAFGFVRDDVVSMGCDLLETARRPNILVSLPCTDLYVKDTVEHNNELLILTCCYLFVFLSVFILCLRYVVSGS
jgi:hypothetical protein